MKGICYQNEFCMAFFSITDTVSPESDTFESTISEKSDESPPIQSGAPTSASVEDKGREIPTDCPLVLGKKCNTNAYADNSLKGYTAAKPADPSPETPDPRQGTKGPVFSTTPMPGSKTDANTSQDQSTTVPAFVTPTTGSRGSCCVKSASKNGAAANLSSTTARQSRGSCCQKFSSAGGLAANTSKPTYSTNGQTKSTAPTFKSGTKANNYDPSLSPCAAYKKFQDSKSVFMVGTTSVS